MFGEGGVVVVGAVGGEGAGERKKTNRIHVAIVVADENRFYFCNFKIIATDAVSLSMRNKNAYICELIVGNGR